MVMRGRYVSKRGGRMPFNGQRLRNLRRHKDITQLQLGKAIGGTQRMISSYERGKESPRADVLSALCNALKVSADYLLELTDTVDLPLSREEWALIREIRASKTHALNDLIIKTTSNQPVDDR